MTSFETILRSALVSAALSATSFVTGCARPNAMATTPSASLSASASTSGAAARASRSDRRSLDCARTETELTGDLNAGLFDDAIRAADHLDRVCEKEAGCVAVQSD